MSDPTVQAIRGSEKARTRVGANQRKRDVWEVWHGRTLVCSSKMRLTEHEARTKVDNERRFGYFMQARPRGVGSK